MSAAMVAEGGRFDRAEHRYTYNGSPLISVTQAIKGAGLVDSTWFSESARERGRLVHMAVQFDAEGDLDESSVDPTIWPYVEAARKFRAETGFVSAGAKHQIYAPEMGYAGTTDDHGAAQTVRIILDWKSGVVPDWAANQTAAYANKIPGGSGCLRWGVQLKPDATYKIRAFEPKDFRRDLSDFLAILRVAQLRRERGMEI